jgi:hypothetical protein
MNKQLETAVDELLVEYPYLTIRQAGGVCPFQAEGTIHDEEFYFRFRHNWAELRIQSGQGWFKPLYSAGGEYGEGEDQGWLDPDEFGRIMRELMGRLERAPILWEFPGVEPSDIGKIKAGDPQSYGAWGHSPEEAWTAMHAPSAYLRSKGIDDATQAQWLAQRQMSPITTTVDDRVFPDPDPFAQAVR